MTKKLLLGLILTVTLTGGLTSATRAVPDDYATISVLPMKARREYFRKLTPQAKSALWQRHFSVILETRQLTTEQRQVIALASKLASPEIFQRGGEPQCANGTAFARSVIVAFPDTKQRGEIFSNLGGPISRSHHATVTQTFPECNCRWDSFCIACSGCGLSPCHRQEGCGCFWISECTSLCGVADV